MQMPRRPPCHAMLIALLATGPVMAAAQVPSQAPSQMAPPMLGTVEVTATANRDPVEKSYRKMVRGMDLFERHHALAPQAALRFRLLPRKAGTDMSRISLDVAGTRTEFNVPLAPDNTFALPRNAQALAEDAVVMPNRRRSTMTWRADVRSPGVAGAAEGARRLGDLRLECIVGMESGLVSNNEVFFARLADALRDAVAYCAGPAPQYLFFADRPIFGVTLVDGARRMELPVASLYAGATAFPKVLDELSFCDCEVLLDRTYVLPLGDRSWPDDARVEFRYMRGPG